ncbi:MAG: hypothetical protein RR709_10180 [Ruthenibacterium sp.]
MKPILPDTYTATDFTDGTGPFEQVYAVKNPFQQQRELEKMTRIAAGCGIRNFKTLYAAYVTSIRQQSKELLIDNATNFDKQPETGAPENAACSRMVHTAKLRHAIIQFCL